MPQTLTNADVQRFIEDGLFNVKNDIAAIKTKQTALDNKLAVFMKKTNATVLAQMAKDFASIKAQSDSIAQLIGSIDMNDISIVVDAKGDNVSFNIGDFDFNSSIKIIDAAKL